MRSLLLAQLIAVLFSGLSIADEKPSGPFWTGTLDVGVRELRFRVETVPNADGSKSQRLVSLDEGGQVFKLDGVRLDDTQLQFEVKISKGAYAGTLSENGTVSTGKWKQAGKEFDLVLRKTDTVPVDMPSEAWSGQINTLLQKLTLRFRVYRSDDGSEKVYLDSVTQKTGGFKAKRMVDGDKWTVSVDPLAAKFEGTINADKTEIKGKWTQGGQSLDLTLTPDKSVAEVTVKAPSRPQMPKAPFPYLTEEVTFSNDVDKVQLAGTLTIPKQDKPCPAAILISGSGPQDRDETLVDHKPFWVLADHLTRQGIAVIRFDDRGTGSSTGGFSTATSEDFSRDVEAALAHLLKDARISKNSIGLIGHSEGGLIAPMVAARHQNVSFAVLLAGPGVNGREILLSQGHLIMKAAGVTDEAVLKAQKTTQLAMFDALEKATATTTQEELVDAVMARLAKSLPQEELEKPEVRASITAGIKQINSPWFRFFLTHEPGPILEKVICPVLALNGEKDVQVDPDLNLPAISTALKKGGNTKFETIKLPNLNHLFQTCTTGSVAEYQSIEETLSPEMLKKVAVWIREQTSAQK